MRYTNLCRLYSFIFRRMLNKNVTPCYGKEFAKSLTQKAKSEYKALIKRTNSIGDKENPMSSNLYQGAVFVAYYKAADGKIPANEMIKISINCLQKSILVKLATRNIHKHSDKYREWIHKTSSWTQKNADRYPLNWIIRENPAMNNKPGTYYEYMRCALFELCKAEGCPEIAPLFCMMDHVTAHFGNSKLIRKGSLAQGAPFCDFYYVEMNKENQ